MWKYKSKSSTGSSLVKTQSLWNFGICENTDKNIWILTNIKTAGNYHTDLDFGV